MENERIKRIREYLELENKDAVLISDPISAEYVSGFSSSNIFLLIKKKSAYVLSDSRYSIAAKSFFAKTKFKFVEISSTNFSFLRKLISTTDKIIIQDNHFSVSNFNKLKDIIPTKNIFFSDSHIDYILAVKDKQEIKKSVVAASLADKAFSLFLNKLKAGMTEIEAARTLDSICYDLGSEEPAFQTIILFGKNSALPHGVPSKKRLCNGDFILADFGCTVSGFRSDMTRTIFFGKISKRQKELYDIVSRAQQKALDKVKNGVTASDIDAAARTVITEAGHEENFAHGTGHGVGRRIHEVPALNRLNNQILKTGMIVTVEPGIYIEKFGGIRIEDSIVVTDKGCRILTKTDKRLTVIS